MDANPGCELVLLGGGGHAREVYSYLLDLEARGPAPRLLAVIDEVNPPGPWEGSKRRGDFSDLRRLLAGRNGRPLYYLTAVGDSRLRQALAQKAEAVGLRAASPLLHPMTSVGRDADIGRGTLLAPGSVVTAKTRVGRHCILNVKASVSHDCTVGDFVTLSPNSTVCGHVRVGDGTLLGAGATLIDGVSVGKWTVVGAGAVVIRDLPDFVTAVGVPARVIKRHAPDRAGAA